MDVIDNLSEITITSNIFGAVSKVEVDGTDYSSKVCAVSFDHTSGDVPRVSLTFIPKKLTICAVGNVMMKDMDLGPLNHREANEDLSACAF